MNELRITRESPVDDVTTTIRANPVRGGGVEFWIEQSTFNNLSKRTSPRRSMLFTVPAEHRQALLDMLKE
jgi:hypothetical protein